MKNLLKNKTDLIFVFCLLLVAAVITMWFMGKIDATEVGVGLAVIGTLISGLVAKFAQPQSKRLLAFADGGGDGDGEGEDPIPDEPIVGGRPKDRE